MDCDYMSVKVPDDILKMTTKCPHAFSCLTLGRCGERKICEVEYINGTHVMFLKDTQETVCRYRLTYGNGQMCTCPMHYAIKCIKQ